MPGVQVKLLQQQTTKLIATGPCPCLFDIIGDTIMHLVGHSFVHGTHFNVVCGNCLVSSRFICINIVFCLAACFCSDMLCSKCIAPLPHNPHCCSLYTLSGCFTCSCVTLHLLLAHYNLCYVDVYCLCTMKQLIDVLYVLRCLLFILFLNFVTHMCSCVYLSTCFLYNSFSPL